MNTATIETGLVSLSAEDYHRLDAVSASRLSDMDRSPAYCRWRIDHPHEDTDATRIGDATHAAVLTPDLFRARYVAAPECDRRTKAGKDAYAAAEAEAAARGGVILPNADFDLCLRLRDAVWQNEEARALLESCTAFEQSIAWKDSGTRLQCKARFDALGDITIPDLKTTRSAQASGFIRSVVSYGYHRQAAWYLRGAAECGLPARDFAFIVVEKAAPFQVAVYRLDKAALDTGATECADLLAQYAECRKANDWPGYPGGVLSLPKWYGAQVSQPEDESGDSMEYPT